MKKVVFIDIISLKGLMPERLRLTLCEKKKDSIHILEDVEVNRGEHGEMYNILRGKELYLSLPFNILGMRILEFPFSDREKINSALPYELSQTILDDIDEVVWDIVEIDSGNGHARVIVVYAKRKDIEEILKGFNHYGSGISVITSLGLSSIRPLFRNLESLTEGVSYSDYKDRYIALVHEELKRPFFNLGRKDVLRSIEYERASKRLRVTRYLLLILIFLILLNFGVRIFYNLRAIDEMDNIISARYKGAFPLESIKSPLLQLRSHIKELKDKDTLLTSIPVLDIMNSIKLIDGVSINEIRIEDSNLNLKGEASQLRDVDLFRNSLSLSFKEVNIVESKQLSGRIKFLITARFEREVLVR